MGAEVESGPLHAARFGAVLREAKTEIATVTASLADGNSLAIPPSYLP
jgi:hypothetical protein